MKLREITCFVLSSYIFIKRNVLTSFQFSIVYWKQWNYWINVLSVFFRDLKSILMFKKHSDVWCFVWRIPQRSGFFFNLKYICYNKKGLLFQLVAYKIYAIIKTIYCFNWLPWTSTRYCHWEVFLEISLNQKTLKLYTSGVHWKNQSRSTIKSHAVMEQAWISTFC